jgi:thymidylate kinase
MKCVIKHGLFIVFEGVEGAGNPSRRSYCPTNYVRVVIRSS